MKTKQGILDLNDLKNGRRACTHAFELGGWTEYDDEGNEYRKRGLVCLHCGKRKERFP